MSRVKRTVEEATLLTVSTSGTTMLATPALGLADALAVACQSCHHEHTFHRKIAGGVYDMSRPSHDDDLQVRACHVVENGKVCGCTH